jgi:YHS domain-containing protein
MKSTRLAFSFAVLASLATACAASPPPPVETSRAEAALLPPGEARVGDRTTCLVSGEQFIVSATSPKTEVGGRTYYFCCADCAKRFEAEPAKFLRTSAEPAGPSPGP